MIYFIYHSCESLIKKNSIKIIGGLHYEKIQGGDSIGLIDGAAELVGAIIILIIGGIIIGAILGAI